MNWLPEIRTLISHALIDGPGWNRLLQRVGELPGEPDASRCGFEFRLGEARAAADFCVVVAPGQVLAEHYVRQAEAAPPGSPRAVRLVLQGVGHAQITHLLERLEWAGSIRTAQAVLAGLRELLPRFWLSVDVSAGGVLPRLGLELFHAGQGNRELGGWWTTGRGEWRPVVEWLVERGWCLPAKARRLPAWCALDRVYDRCAVYLVYKGINHVKLTLEEDGAVQAKAYAGAALTRLTDQRSAVESSRERESAAAAPC